MLVPLRRGPKRAPGDLVASLAECHDRIREHLRLARLVAERGDARDADVVDACARIERYFSEALPLHVADEEDSLVPRLRGRSPELDAALDVMAREHAEHAPRLAALVSASRVAGARPFDAPARAAVGEAATALEAAFASHLAAEEAVVFPAVRALPESEQRAIGDELRRRRATGR